MIFLVSILWFGSVLYVANLEIYPAKPKAHPKGTSSERNAGKRVEGPHHLPAIGRRIGE